MAGIFKAYDIRGVYGDTLTDEIMLKVGRAFATFLNCKRVIVGRDMRPHSNPLFEAMSEGLTRQGAEVVDIGLCSTPMLYYAAGKLESDAGIMITASHNPGEWNGAKMTREQAIPISGATGIQDIEKIINEDAYHAPAEKRGTISHYDIGAEYSTHVRNCANLARPVRVAVDMANGMGIVEARALEGIIEMDTIFDELDGTFPNHEANPLKAETYETLQAMVSAGSYDFGIAFDGDADRVGFVDEKGSIVPMDIITALVARDILTRQQGVIFYDLRSSWAVKEVIEEQGGTPMMSRVGHAFIKQQMRDNDALFAGELSGHYYFKDNYFTESSSMAVISVANIVSRADESLSELVKPIQRYVASGEINSEVPDAGTVLDRIRTRYADGRQFELDGISVEYDDWWLNVRASNTEPLIRLNLEAKTQHLMDEKRDELLGVIRCP
jgi:phosphomannomutase